MTSVNKVILVGNVGQNPELKTTTNGVTYLRFSLATSESWKDKATGQKKELTTWHNIKLYDPLAKSLSPFIKKGSKIFVEGSIRVNDYEKNGQKMTFTEILGKNVVLLDKYEGAPERVNNLDFLDDAVPF